MKRSESATNTSSLMPRAYGLPKSNSLPCARNPRGPLASLYHRSLLSFPAGVQSITTEARASASSALVAHLVAQPLEVLADVVADGELGAARHQVVELGAVRLERRALVERHLVDAHAGAEVGEQADQGLADGAGAHDVNDCRHTFLTSLSAGCADLGATRASGANGTTIRGASPSRRGACRRASSGRGSRTRRARPGTSTSVRVAAGSQAAVLALVGVDVPLAAPLELRERLVGVAAAALDRDVADVDRCVAGHVERRLAFRSRRGSELGARRRLRAGHAPPPRGSPPSRTTRARCTPPRLWCRPPSPSAARRSRPRWRCGPRRRRAPGRGRDGPRCSFATVSLSSPRLTARNWTSSFHSATSGSRILAWVRQGPHQVAQKSTTTTLPLKSAGPVSPPSRFGMRNLVRIGGVLAIGRARDRLVVARLGGAERPADVGGDRGQQQAGDQREDEGRTVGRRLGVGFHDPPSIRHRAAFFEVRAGRRTRAGQRQSAAADHEQPLVSPHSRHL